MIGLGTSDDAGVYRLDASTALVQTVDFFAPIVDDAYDWGRIAAANALSDVYAMGARPLTAMALVGWPRDSLPFELLADVMQGGADVLAAAQCTLVGGHSVDEPEPKYGLAVTGLVDPSRVVANAGARPGDDLVLTKAIGTGIIATAIKRGTARAAHRDGAVASMVELNEHAAAAMVAHGAHAATDVTGFGLLGHLLEMLHASGVGAVVRAAAVPVLAGTMEYARDGIVPGGTHRNIAAVSDLTDFGPLDPTMRLVLADAQTSGGLLISAPDGAALVEAVGPPAAIIGTVTAGEPRIVVE